VRRGNPRRRLTFAALVLLSPAACRDAKKADETAAPTSAVSIALARPSFALRTTDGRPFAFGSETRGTLTFLLFGYTNCPDVCPVHLANLTAALAKRSVEERARTRVVFVTVDPDRDTPAVLRKFLDAFDPSYIGLTGTRAALDAAQRAVNFGPAIISTDSAGTPVVTHSAPVVVFTADDSAHVMYPFGTRQVEWAKDIPLLLERGVPKSALRVTRAYLVIPVGDAPAALYFSVRNEGAAADSVVGVEVAGAGQASLHEHEHDMKSGAMRMVPATSYPVGAQGVLQLAPGGAHVMIEKPARLFTRGEKLRGLVRFGRAGSVPVDVTVITYADLDSATAPSRN
jgi:protein SCO1/2